MITALVPGLSAWGRCLLASAGLKHSRLALVTAGILPGCGRRA